MWLWVKLMLAVFGSGALAGFVLFSVQHFTVIPLIQAAETYEAAHSDAPHGDEGWQPAERWERTFFTALTTVLTGIGFAAMLFVVMALAGETINTRLGCGVGTSGFCLFQSGAGSRITAATSASAPWPNVVGPSGNG